LKDFLVPPRVRDVRGTRPTVDPVAHAGLGFLRRAETRLHAIGIGSTNMDRCNPAERRRETTDKA
jgi:hypothetical protein